MFKNLSQQSHPRLWLAFQYLLGSPSAKRRIALSHIGNNARNILEVGCSVGTVADAFKQTETHQYMGIDIDEQAVRIAKEKYRDYPHMSFSSEDMEQLVKGGRKFDCVLFAHILHHVDDKKAQELLQLATKLVATNGILIIMEPDTLRKEDSVIVRLLYRFEKGLYRRSYEHLITLAEQTGMHVNSDATEFYSIGLLPGILCGHMQVITLQYI